VNVPRPRRVALLVALTATFALLCCGGAISALLVEEFDKPKENLNLLSENCGAAGPIDPESKLPEVGQYDAAQMKNAAIIINVGKQLKLPPRAWVIAVATAMQESNLRNLGHLGKRNDHDSLGLFQQRPSSGWGSPAQVTDPAYAATKFYTKLRKVRNWDGLALTKAAQRVQISAYPGAYAKHEPIATQIVNLLADGAANAVGNSVTPTCPELGQVSAAGWTSPLAASGKGLKRKDKMVVGSGFRTASRPRHQGVDLIISKGNPVRSVASGVVSRIKCDETFSGRKDCDVDGYPGKGGCGWMLEIRHPGKIMTRYCHLLRRPELQVGQKVTAGQVVATSGNSGNSSGDHLHFEVHRNNDRSSASAVDPVQFMADHGSPLGASQ
jgi:murein DD-endopeptidase MepM/ murein hydrolase activator NlpD